MRARESRAYIFGTLRACVRACTAAAAAFAAVHREHTQAHNLAHTRTPKPADTLGGTTLIETRLIFDDKNLLMKLFVSFVG